MSEFSKNESNTEVVLDQNVVLPEVAEQRPVVYDTSKVSVKELIEFGVHFGHKTSKWSPKMEQFIWGSRNKAYLIDVAKTAYILEKAAIEIKKIVRAGGKILWVGTKMAAKAAIEKAGKDLSMPYVSHRWIGGTLTNFDQVKKGVTILLHLKDVVQKPLSNLKKKEVVRIKKEVERLEKNFGGIINLTYPPAAIVIVDVLASSTTLKEAHFVGIPVIGVVDTNSDPSSLAIAIPANDDSQKSVGYIVGFLSKAAEEGLAIYNKEKAEEQKSILQRAAEKLKSNQAQARTTEASAEKKASQSPGSDNSAEKTSDGSNPRPQQNRRFPHGQGAGNDSSRQTGSGSHGASSGNRQGGRYNQQQRGTGSGNGQKPYYKNQQSGQSVKAPVKSPVVDSSSSKPDVASGSDSSVKSENKE